MQIVKNYLLLFLVCHCFMARAEFHENKYHYDILKVTDTIIADGLLNETAWSKASPITEFWEHYPIDTNRSQKEYSLKLLYSEKYLYISLWCKATDPKPVVQNLVRDDNGPFWSSDGLSVIIDPSNQNQNGYYFALNANGAKQDGLMSQQGFQSKLDIFWNTAWEGGARIDSKGYYFEFAIPLTALKFDPAISNWGVNFIHNDMEYHSYNIWTKFDSSIHGLDFNYNGTMCFTEGLPQTKGKRLELKPAVSSAWSRDIESGGEQQTTFKAGIDAKYALSDKLSVDLAILPDYSTADVDKQYIDFYRFEYKEPEQREFFLENSDLFSLTGSDDDWGIVPWNAYKIKPFYSRRIGIKNWQHTPIYYGARLSGSLTGKLRIGILNMQTGEYENEPAQNYTAAAARQQFNDRFSVSTLILNRQGISNTNSETIAHSNSYNRNAGIEIDFSNKKKNLTSSYLYYRSQNPESVTQANMYGAEFDFFSKNFRTKSVLYRTEDNFIADMGYTPRLFHRNFTNDTVFRFGYSEASNYSTLSFYPNKKFRQFKIISNLSSYFNNHYTAADEFIYQFIAYAETNGNNGFSISANRSRFRLHFSNDVLKNNKPINAGLYDDFTLAGEMSTNNTKRITFRTRLEYGEFYNGQKLVSELTLGIRFQPWGVFSFSGNRFQYSLPQYDQEGIYRLVSARADVSFNRKTSWTSLFQYNTQSSQITFNSLFKWRFRPLCYFYFVIKNNAGIDFSQQTIQASCKLSFWFKA